MTFTQVRQYAVGLLRASFTNKAVLDALADDNGTLTYNGNEIGGGSAETISTQDIEDAIAEDVDEINGVEDEEEQEPAEEQNP